MRRILFCNICHDVENYVSPILHENDSDNCFLWYYWIHQRHTCCEGLTLFYMKLHSCLWKRVVRVVHEDFSWYKVSVYPHHAWELLVEKYIFCLWIIAISLYLGIFWSYYRWSCLPLFTHEMFVNIYFD